LTIGTNVATVLLCEFWVRVHVGHDSQTSPHATLLEGLTQELLWDVGLVNRFKSCRAFVGSRFSKFTWLQYIYRMRDYHSQKEKQRGCEKGELNSYHVLKQQHFLLRGKYQKVWSPHTREESYQPAGEILIMT
jgi:hypothetical protein